MTISKEWIMGILAALIVGLLSWAGLSIVSFGNQIAALEATQKQLVSTVNLTLEELMHLDEENR